ncbi:MAG: EamA family transporter [Synergistetes bacterium]|nr:EamA family transporter [Synergistota bacterium]
MKAELFALLTAACWGIGSFFEKKGLALGNIPPFAGAALRTAISLLILTFLALPSLSTLLKAGWKPFALVAFGGGLLAGSLGIAFFYTAIKSGELGKVLPIAFTSPFFGVLMALLFKTETITFKNALGMILTITGIIILTLR